MRLILMGPPGAGKGTQANIVATRLGVPTIATGDIFRANVVRKTPLGLEAQRYMDLGEYVPDQVTNAMVEDRLLRNDCEPGFVLDGYPRTVAQVAELDKMLARLGVSLDAVVSISLEQDKLVQRLLKRAHLEGRADDTEEIIRRRQQVYLQQTQPLISVYRERGLLLEVAGSGQVQAVTRRILDLIPRDH